MSQSYDRELPNWPYLYSEQEGNYSLILAPLSCGCILTVRLHVMQQTDGRTERQKGLDNTVRVHYMQSHGIVKAFLSFCPSVGLSVDLSNAWIVTKRKKLVPTFLYYMKDRSS